jgi:putative membrane protein
VIVLLASAAIDAPWLRVTTLLALAAAAAGYVAASLPLWRSGCWPGVRIVLWCAGIFAVAVALVGPLAQLAHHDFAAHMVGHLLLGMLAPLLLVLAAPVTVALRRLPAVRARRLTRLLAAAPVRLLTHPVTASLLNIGGLWLLYRTGLYSRLDDSLAVHMLVHAHVLGAGYLFAFAFVGVDPAPHRPRFATRAVVLLIALAAHAVLAKSLYAGPPPGVPIEQARSGAMVMYYGGDAVDLVLITVFFRQWFTATRPRRRPDRQVEVAPQSGPAAVSSRTTTARHAGA